MDKKNVLKSIWRNLFAQNRAALGNLRNFFGAIGARAYMVRGHAPSLNPVCGGRCQKGRLCSRACPFFGVSCFQKKAFGVLGTVFGGIVPRACPFFGVSCFRETWFAILGTVACPFWRKSFDGMSPKRGFLFPGNMVCRFGDCCMPLLAEII